MTTAPRVPRSRKRLVLSRWISVPLAFALLSAAPASAQFELEDAGAELPYPHDRELLRRELTQPAGRVELGAFFVSEDSFQFGKFNGLDDKGFELLGNVDLEWRAPWDSGETRHWRVQGLNLGLDSRFLRAEYGEQGRFRVWLENDKIPNFGFEDGLTPFGGRRGQTLTLPSGWVPASTADTIPSLAGSLDTFDVQHERQALRGGFEWLLPEHWEFETSWERETRDGVKLVGAVLGVNGGNPATALVPEPIDYQTHEVDANLRFNGRRAQFELGYSLSHFNNLDDSVVWTTPYSTVGGWDPAAGFPSQGRKSGPPDNRFQQVTASGGFTLPANTRVVANAAYGWMRQNESFFPYTINPGLSVTTPLPETDLDGEIETTLLNLRVVSRPFEKVRIDAGYRFDDRDNNTPVDIYQYVPGDAADQGSITSSLARRNRPYSFKLHEAMLEVGYEILPRTELALGYEHEAIDRTFTEREETREDFYRVSFHSRPAPTLTLRADLERSRRNGSEYVDNKPFLEGFSPQHIADLISTGDPLFENAPALRKFYIADRERDSLRAAATWMPVERLMLSLSTELADEDYRDSILGLQERQTSTYTADLAFSPCDHVHTHAFYTFEDLESQQRGRSWLGFLPSQTSDPTRDWRTEDSDTVDTVGAGVDVELMKGRLTVGADYAYSRTKGRVDVATASGLAAALDLPDVMMRLHNASLQVRYRLRPEVTLRFGYLFEWVEADDFATEGIGVVVPGFEETIFVAEEDPEYRAHVFTLSFVYDFW